MNDVRRESNAEVVLTDCRRCGSGTGINGLCGDCADDLRQELMAETAAEDFDSLSGSEAIAEGMDWRE